MSHHQFTGTWGSQPIDDYSLTPVDDGVRAVLELLMAEHPDSPTVGALAREIIRSTSEGNRRIDDVAQQRAAAEREKRTAERNAADRAQERDTAKANHAVAVQRADAVASHLRMLGNAALDELCDRYRSKPLPPATDALVTWIEDELVSSLENGLRS